MHIKCSYCNSTQIHRIFLSHPTAPGSRLQHYRPLLSCLGLSKVLIKTLSRGSPLSPWMVGLAEVVIQGVCRYLLETQQPYVEAGLSIAYYCEQCQRSFTA